MNNPDKYAANKKLLKQWKWLDELRGDSVEDILKAVSGKADKLRQLLKTSSAGYDFSKLASYYQGDG